MSTAYAGIDPGTTGAVAIIAPDGSIRVWDMPTIKTKVGKAFKNLPDEHAMLEILRGLLASIQYQATSVHVTLEVANPMPSIPGAGGIRRSMGATSAFSFAFNYACWCMALTALEIPHERVHPRRWKSRVLTGVGAQDDGAVAQIAGRLYPSANAQLRGPKGGLKIGRVDALLIAHYGRQQAALDQNDVPIT